MDNSVLPLQLRYNIAERLDRAGRQYALQIRRRIISKHNIAPSTWHDWLKLKIDAPRDLPAQVLRDLAVMMNLPMECFFNDKTGNDERCAY